MHATNKWNGEPTKDHTSCTNKTETNIFAAWDPLENRSKTKRQTNVGSYGISSRLVRYLFHLILLLNFFDSQDDCGACEIREFITMASGTIRSGRSIRVEGKLVC